MAGVSRLMAAKALTVTAGHAKTAWIAGHDVFKAKVTELQPDGKTMKVSAGVGWKPGVVGEVIVRAERNSPEGLTLEEGAIARISRVQAPRFSASRLPKPSATPVWSASPRSSCGDTAGAEVVRGRSAQAS
jgi:hypothetical protein